MILYWHRLGNTTQWLHLQCKNSCNLWKAYFTCKECSAYCFLRNFTHHICVDLPSQTIIFCGFKEASGFLNMNLTDGTLILNPSSGFLMFKHVIIQKSSNESNSFLLSFQHCKNLKLEPKCFENSISNQVTPLPDLTDLNSIALDKNMDQLILLHW